MTSHNPQYSHTQTAPLCWIIYGTAGCCLILATILGNSTVRFPVLVVGLVIALLASSVHYLKVTDRGDWLAVRFGPLPLFYKKGTCLPSDRNQDRLGCAEGVLEVLERFEESLGAGAEDGH
jgi:hypothetical protein